MHQPPELLASPQLISPGCTTYSLELPSSPKVRPTVTALLHLTSHMPMSEFFLTVALPPMVAQKLLTSTEGPRMSVVPVSSTAIGVREPGISDGERRSGLEFTVIPRRGSF